MRSIRRSLVVLATAASIAGCHKSSETELTEAEHATRVAQEKAVHAQRELERGPGSAAERALEESREAAKEAREEHDEAADAAARERTKLGAVLTREIEWLDKRVGEMARDAMTVAPGAVRDEKLRDVDKARAWRDRLQADLEELRKEPAGAAWTTLKTRIERDLDEDRPLGIPRSFEKPYGI
jgi:hypothetical protein